jgi:RNA polymerase sigma factor (sigma-70 family)
MVNAMEWELATDNQLWNIVKYDKDCPAALLSGVAIEMIKRNLWDTVTVYAARKVFKNVPFVLEQRLKMDLEELKQIANIEIAIRIRTFIPGMRTLKTYVIMCLVSKFGKMLRDVHVEKRRSNIGNKSVDKLPEELQTRIFRSHENVEKKVINKIIIQDGLERLSERERQAIYLVTQGYQQYEIATMLGFKNKMSGHKLLNRAYSKMRKYIGA